MNEDYLSEDIKIKNDAIQNNSAGKEHSTSIPTPNVGSRKSEWIPSGRGYSGKTYSKTEVIQLIKNYSAEYGISPSLPLKIAQCESGYNQFAKNKHSTASGVFQYLASTWRSTDEGKAGLSVFDAEANIRAAIKYIASRGHAKPWEASRKCWQRS